RKKVTITTNMSPEQIVSLLRNLKGTSLEVTSGLAGISKSLLDKIERGKRHLTPRVALALCTALGLNETDPIRIMIMKKVHEEDSKRKELKESELAKKLEAINALNF